MPTTVPPSTGAFAMLTNRINAIEVLKKAFPNPDLADVENVTFDPKVINDSFDGIKTPVLNQLKSFGLIGEKLAQFWYQAFLGETSAEKVFAHTIANGFAAVDPGPIPTEYFYFRYALQRMPELEKSLDPILVKEIKAKLNEVVHAKLVDALIGTEGEGSPFPTEGTSISKLFDGSTLISNQEYGSMQIMPLSWEKDDNIIKPKILIRYKQGTKGWDNEDGMATINQDVWQHIFDFKAPENFPHEGSHDGMVENEIMISIRSVH